MKKLLLITLVFILLAGCGPSEADIQKAIEETQAAAPTIEPTEEPTQQPTKKPTPTYRPTKTLNSPLPTITPNVQSIVNNTIEGLQELILGYTETESINVIRPGKEAFEIEVKTMWASKDSQPDVSFEIIKILADVFGNTTETQLLNFIDGEVDNFSVIITTYSTDGDYKYQSRTYYDTLIKLYNKRLSYEEWVQESSADFAQ